MVWLIILGIFIILTIISTIIFIREAKKAPLISEIEPFLKDDYVPNGEEYFKHYNAFCKHCNFFDGTATCLNGKNFGLIDDNKAKNCKKNSLFEAK